MSEANVFSRLQIERLMQPSLFAHPVENIRLVETHISWVILTGSFAYKIKKPVDLGFLDFSTLEKRHFYCKEEIRLNRRLAADYYLDVVPIRGSLEAPHWDGEGEVVEYAVKMRQFPQDAQLDRLLAKGEIVPGCQACLRPRDRFWDIPVPKIDSAFDNLLVPQPSWSPSTTQQLRKLVAAPYLAPI